MKTVDGEEAGALAADRLQLLGRISAGVVHDVANYLSVIDTSLALAQRACGDAHGKMELLRARGVVDRAARLTKALLSHGRTVAPAREAVDLNTLVASSVELLQRAFPPKVSCLVEVERTAAPIAGVVVELEQLVLNLMLNACDAMPQGGVLQIAVVPNGTSIALRVTDDGRGISPDVAASSGSSSPSAKPGRGGAGLGLGIVRTIAARHDAAFTIGPCPPFGTRAEVKFPKLT